MRSIPVWLVPILVVAAVAQSATSPAAANATHDNHGLVLTLSRDPDPQPPDAAQLKACLAHNTPINCIPLIAKLKNEGKETILSSWTSCPPLPIGYAFELRTLEGDWERLPPGANGGFTCTATVGGISAFSPGGVFKIGLRLADTEYSLPGEGPHWIRTCTDIGLCVASTPIDSDVNLEPKNCVGGDLPKQRLGLVCSNELEIRASSLLK